jgi:predicted metal-dependent RNase
MAEVIRSVIKDVRERCYVRPDKLRQPRRPKGPDKGKPTAGEYIPRPTTVPDTKVNPVSGDDTEG